MELNKNEAELRTAPVFVLTVTTVILALIGTFVGYLVSPVTAAIYAALLFADKTRFKLPSIIIPIAFLGFNFLINGKYEIDAVIFIPMALIIFLFYRTRASKGTAVVAVTASYLLFLFLLIALYSVKQTGQFDFQSIVDFYVAWGNEIKATLLDEISSTEAYATLFTSGYVDLVFNTVFSMMPALLAVISLLFAGISLKLFRGAVIMTTEDRFAYGWHLRIPTPVCIFFVALAVISFFEINGYIGLALSWLNLLFSALFAHYGAEVVVYEISARKSKRFAILMLVLAFITLPSLAFTLLSYVGVYAMLVVNRAQSDAEDE